MRYCKWQGLGRKPDAASCPRKLVVLRGALDRLPFALAEHGDGPGTLSMRLFTNVGTVCGHGSRVTFSHWCVPALPLVRPFVPALPIVRPSVLAIHCVPGTVLDIVARRAGRRAVPPAV
jgi:hypothetical protein